MHMLNVGVGMTFSGGFIDLFLFGILQGNAKTSWINVVFVGVLYFVVYYFLFSFLIKKMDLKTPGRDTSEEVKLYKRSDVDAKKKGSSKDELSEMITKGLGGKKNISDVDCCATRLRCTVYKSELVNEGILKQTGASGVVHKGQGVQIIYGPRVTVIKSNLEDYLVSAPDVEIETEEVKVDKTEKVEKKKTKVKRTIILGSPLTGEAKDITETPDDAFAQRMMGDGAVIMPSKGEVTAPEDGEICFVFPSNHAVGFRTKDGIELLIHIGIDTVNLNGEGFEAFVKEGDKVKKGDKILSFNIDEIKDKVPSMASPYVITSLNDNMEIRLLKNGKIKSGEDLIAIDELE